MKILTQRRKEVNKDAKLFYSLFFLLLYFKPLRLCVKKGFSNEKF